ncbi:MAG: hypothetical protein LBF00_00220 [Mycoplasmataceae bacterium]|jgi:hypothetical protein|nr:hypothetical protein [Mycoplasmataceae bacterium]
MKKIKFLFIPIAAVLSAPIALTAFNYNTRLEDDTNSPENAGFDEDK